MKLLRKIRQQLIEKGNFKNYVFYAIGEIFLVMVGILLALQVNNWNQNKIEQKKERKALTDLYKEFKINKERIQKKQALRIQITPKLAKYVQQVTAGKVNYNTFKEFHKDQFMFGMTNPSNGVLNALISSGEIALISNDSLKYLISDWKNQAENLYENEEILWDSGLGYIESYSKKILSPTHNWDGWNSQKLEVAFKNLLSDIEYKNKLVGFQGVNAIVIEECDNILKLLERILLFLEEEIKGRS